jgi:hypothetical protein
MVIVSNKKASARQRLSNFDFGFAHLWQQVIQDNVPLRRILSARLLPHRAGIPTTQPE